MPAIRRPLVVRSSVLVCPDSVRRVGVDTRLEGIEAGKYSQRLTGRSLTATVEGDGDDHFPPNPANGEVMTAFQIRFRKTEEIL